MIGDMPDLLGRRAALSPACVALECAVTGAGITYAELDRRAARAAALLADRGVAAGDRVSLLCRNRPEFFELLFACARIGAILVPLNWRMPPAELDQLLTDCTPRLLLHGAEDAGAAAQLMYPPPAIALDDGYAALRDAAVPRAVRGFWPADDIWYLLYTSGTTGRPKGVIYTYRMALANYVSIGAAIGLREGDATPNFLPLCHTAGINLHALPTLIAGGTVVVLPRFDAGALVALLEARRFDTVFAVPTVYRELLDHPRFAAAPLGHVRHWGCGGAALPDAVAARFQALGVRMCHGMGMTETGPTALLAAPEDAWDRVGSVGRPQLLCSARIVDAGGRDVADGAVGDLQFAGPGVTPGYWRNAEATEAAFTSDGWLRSGDLARRDADGFFHIVGRRKEMFVSGGDNVYPAEVEQVLNAHPAVAEAAVIAQSDPKWGETGRAYLLLHDAAPAPSPDALSAFCRARLAAYKVPRDFRYVGDFPRTAAGKVQKHLLG